MENSSWFFYFIIWFICGLITRTIVKNKGYTKNQQIFWGIVGFLLGLIGILVTLFLPKKTEGFIESGEMMLCPKCRQPISVDASVCRYCRSSTTI